MYMHIGDKQNTRVGVTIIVAILTIVSIIFRAPISSPFVCFQQTVATKHPAAVIKDIAFNPCSSPTQQIRHL